MLLMHLHAEKKFLVIKSKNNNVPECDLYFLYKGLSI